MKNKTAEEVYVEMLKPAETVTIKVHHRPDEFNMLKDVPGDGFYIRYVCMDTYYTWTQMDTLAGFYVLLYKKRNALIFAKQPSLSMLLYLEPALECPMDELKSFSIMSQIDGVM